MNWLKNFLARLKNKNTREEELTTILVAMVFIAISIRIFIYFIRR